jgi:hypothetical protein
MKIVMVRKNMVIREPHDIHIWIEAQLLIFIMPQYTTLLLLRTTFDVSFVIATALGWYYTRAYENPNIPTHNLHCRLSVTCWKLSCCFMYCQRVILCGAVLA